MTRVVQTGLSLLCMCQWSPRPIDFYAFLLISSTLVYPNWALVDVIGQRRRHAEQDDNLGTKLDREPPCTSLLRRRDNSPAFPDFLTYLQRRSLRSFRALGNPSSVLSREMESLSGWFAYVSGVEISPHPQLTEPKASSHSCFPLANTDVYIRSWRELWCLVVPRGRENCRQGALFQ